jgi:2-polyprenyl-3-methyl-5-hydroxy-6-metoxy-1,4-benzoquinol methylase
MTLDLSLGEETPMECPVCNDAGSAVLRQAYDDRYGQPVLFHLVRCTHCGHLMTSRRLKESDLGALYSTYYPRKQVNVEDLKREAAHSIRPWARLRRWWAGTDNQGQYAVRTGELMLDIGCGSGLSLLEARALGAEVRGIEADPNVQRIADELGLRIHIGSLLDEPFASEQFDLVVLNQVIEHMPDPALTLDRLRSRLKRGGRIVLVFPNVESFWRRLSGDSWINWHIPYHLHHFSRSGFERMAARLGYEVRSVRTITPNLWTILQIRASRSRVERGVPSPIWAVPAHPVQSQTISPPMRQGVGRVLRGFARRAVRVGLMLPIVLVNRLVDAMSWGDSVMVEIVPAEMP